jgi:hypothetical protein
VRPDLLGPTPGAKFTRGESVPFRFRVDRPGYRLVVTISSTRDTDADGRLKAEKLIALGNPSAEEGDELTYEALAEPSATPLPNRPGRYYWQVLGFGFQDSVARPVLSPIRSFEVTVPAADRRRRPIPRSMGRHASHEFSVSTRGVPDGVGFKRLRALAERSARRWSLRPQGVTSRVSTARDGRNVVGFGRVPRGALGVQRTYVWKLYRVSGGRRTYAGRRIVERDISIDPTLKWNTRKEYPAFDEYDLETVLVHELGHFAGNLFHKRDRCENSPMIVSLAAGEWWHTPNDSYVFACQASLAAAARNDLRRVGPRPKPRRFVHREVVVGSTTLPASSDDDGGR